MKINFKSKLERSNYCSFESKKTAAPCYSAIPDKWWIYTNVTTTFHRRNQKIHQKTPNNLPKKNSFFH